MNHDNSLKTISVPESLFGSMIQVYRQWKEFSDEFEDFLLASDKKFIVRMRKARKEHLGKKAQNLEILKQELV